MPRKRCPDAAAADAARLRALEAAAREAVRASMEAELPAASERQLVDAEMARALGDAPMHGGRG